jgi:ADP-heptose:LPS heptosyltransferase
VIASQAPVRLGWCGGAEDPEASGLSHGTPDVRHQAERHWSRYQLLPMRGLGLTRPSYDLPFLRDAEAEAEAEQLYGQKPRRVLLIPGRPKLAVSPPSEGFEAIGRAALEHRAPLVVVGAPEEGPLIKSLQKALGGGVQAYTKKDLSTLVALVRQADVVITNDTGPMHLAFLMDRPTIAIFTYMSPVCWGPPQPSPRAVVLNANAGALDPARVGMYTRRSSKISSGSCPGALDRPGPGSEHSRACAP